MAKKNPTRVSKTRMIAINKLNNKNILQAIQNIVKNDGICEDPKPEGNGISCRGCPLFCVTTGYYFRHLKDKRRLDFCEKLLLDFELLQKESENQNEKVE